MISHRSNMVSHMVLHMISLTHCLTHGIIHGLTHCLTRFHTSIKHSICVASHPEKFPNPPDLSSDSKGVQLKILDQQESKSRHMKFTYIFLLKTQIVRNYRLPQVGIIGSVIKYTDRHQAPVCVCVCLPTYLSRPGYIPQYF